MHLQFPMDLVSRASVDTFRWLPDILQCNTLTMMAHNPAPRLPNGYQLTDRNQFVGT